VNNGLLTHYHGDYQYYLDKSAAIAAAIAASAATVAPVVNTSRPKGKEQKREEAEARNARSRERREHEKIVADSEKENRASRGENRKELTAELEKTRDVRQARPRRRRQSRVEHHHRRPRPPPPADWEQAAARVNELKPAPEARSYAILTAVVWSAPFCGILLE